MATSGGGRGKEPSARKPPSLVSRFDDRESVKLHREAPVVMFWKIRWKESVIGGRSPVARPSFSFSGRKRIVLLGGEENIERERAQRAGQSRGISPVGGLTKEGESPSAWQDIEGKLKKHLGLSSLALLPRGIEKIRSAVRNHVHQEAGGGRAQD